MEKKYYVLSEVASNFISQNKIKPEYAQHLENCPTCSSKRHKKIFNIHGFDYYKCKTCGFVFVNPRLNDEGSYKWYNSDYYKFALGQEIYTNTKNDNYYSTSLSTPHFNKIIKIILDNFPDKKTKIIDVGCSTGSVLAFLRDEHGYTNLRGIDLSEKAVQFAVEKRKLNVELKDITNLDENDKFDLVINTENIEHVNSLEKYMANIKKLLNKDGYLLITTPNNDLKVLKYLKKMSDHYCAPNHINYFNDNTIEMFLDKNGLKATFKEVDIKEGYSLYSIIKSRLTNPDQVVAAPGYKANFNKANWSFFKKDTIKVSVIKMSENEFVNENNPYQIENTSLKSKGIISNLKKLVRNMLNFKVINKHRSHLFVLSKIK
jgi:2-polyprenyl-3-methyl-5-hydroxy-6-metoxy-1,4-benzoquinol methylase